MRVPRLRNWAAMSHLFHAREQLKGQLVITHCKVANLINAIVGRRTFWSSWRRRRCHAEVTRCPHRREVGGRLGEILIPGWR